MAHKVTHENHYYKIILSAISSSVLSTLSTIAYTTHITFNEEFLVILLSKIKCVELVVNSAVKTAKL